MASHTVYAVASGKGGVGKTATTVNLGASLAEAGYTVAIVDTDLGMANLAGFIGIEPEQTLHEVLAGDATLEEATYEALNGLAVLPSGISLNGFANVETAALADAVDALRDAFDYVLLDLGAGLSHDTVLPLALADAVILVSTPQPAAVQDTAKTREITERLGGRVAGVVLTRAGNPADLTLEEVEETLEMPVLASIPEDNAVPASAREGQAVLQYDPDSPAVEGYRGLAGIIEEESLENAPVVPEVPEKEPDEPEPAPAEGTSTEDTAPEEADADDGGTADGAEPSPETAAEGDADQPAARPSGDATADGVEADAGEVAEPDEPPEPTAGATAEAESEPATGADDAERTAAEIAAAIEEAAGGADAVPDAAGDSGGASEQDAGDEPGSEPVDSAESGAATPESGGATGEDVAGGDESEVAVGEQEVTGAEAEESPDAGGEEAFKVESQTAEESDEGKAVDELFSVEGASPDEIGDDEDDDEEDSGGLLSGLLG